MLALHFQSALAKFGCGDAITRLPTGGYGNKQIPVNDPSCYHVENEFHVMIKFCLYDNLRHDLM